MNNDSFEMRVIMDDLYRQQEAIINDQLGDLIKKGILIVEMTNPVLVKNPFDQYKVELRQGLRVTIKEKEYIQKIEKENLDLREKLNKVQELVK